MDEKQLNFIRLKLSKHIQFGADADIYMTTRDEIMMVLM